MFEKSKEYTREYIHTVCGGSKQAFLPTKNGKVVAICLRQDLNPHAPDAILCSSAASTRAAGRTLATQSESVPLFVRSETDKYRYIGHFAAAESLTTPTECAPYVVNSGFKLAQVSRVIKLKPIAGAK